MDGLIHGALGLGGLALGWACNAFAIQLSTKISTIMGNILKESKGKASAKWTGWFMAVAIYLILAVSGVGIAMKFPIKMGGAKSYVGYIISGFGAGALVDELINVPKLDTLGQGIKVGG